MNPFQIIPKSIKARLNEDYKKDCSAMAKDLLKISKYKHMKAFTGFRIDVDDSLVTLQPVALVEECL